MKRFFIVSLVLALCACKVQKTGEDTYKVVAPTPEAKAATEKAKVNAAHAAEKLKAGATDVAKRAGAELKDVGQKVESHTSHESSTSTTETVSSTETPATSTTVTRTHNRSTRGH